MNDKQKKLLLKILGAVSLALVIFNLAVLIGINLRFIYYIDLKIFDLERMSGMNKKEILSVYHKLVNFLHPFYFHSFPITDESLVSSSSIKHFKEVKMIFNVIYFLGLLGIIGLTSHHFLSKKFKIKDFSFIKLTFFFYLSVVIILLFFIICFFDQTFVIFHKILFRNNDWLFNDDIIYILPAEFFMHAGIAIGVLIILLSTILYIIYRKYLNKKEQSR